MFCFVFIFYSISFCYFFSVCFPSRFVLFLDFLFELLSFSFFFFTPCYFPLHTFFSWSIHSLVYSLSNHPRHDFFSPDIFSPFPSFPFYFFSCIFLSSSFGVSHTFFVYIFLRYLHIPVDISTSLPFKTLQGVDACNGPSWVVTSWSLCSLCVD